MMEFLCSEEHLDKVKAFFEDPEGLSRVWEEKNARHWRAFGRMNDSGGDDDEAAAANLGGMGGDGGEDGTKRPRRRNKKEDNKKAARRQQQRFGGGDYRGPEL